MTGVHFILVIYYVCLNEHVVGIQPSTDKSACVEVRLR